MPTCKRRPWEGETPTARAAPHIDLKKAKKAARLVARERRAGMDPALGAELAKHVLAEAPPPSYAVVAGYWPIGEEIDIRPLLTHLIERGHVVVLPATPERGEVLSFRRWRPGETLISEPFGTLTPVGTLIGAPPTGETLAPDFVLVPLLAFDRHGRRLGYGGGFYDRTLARMPEAEWMGCAYACQEMAEVPAGPDDVRLPAVATERGVIRCIGVR